MDLNNLDDDNSKEPLSLAERLKLKGSPVDMMKAGGKEKKARAPKEPKEPKEPKGEYRAKSSNSLKSRK